MRARAIVAWASLSAEAGGRIEAIRKEHDPNAGRIAAHFTLLFPTGALGKDMLATRATSAAAETAPFRFMLRRLAVHEDPASTYVFLMPQDGDAELTALHRHLNASEGPSPDFRPHVTIARFPRAERAQAFALAECLVDDPIAVEGWIRRLGLVEIDDAGEVQVVRSFDLRGAAR